jgi:hypothetical protein
MTVPGQTQSSGDVGSMSGLPESGHGWRFMRTRPKEIVRAAGYIPAIVLRHEIGHCNGWPKEHPGAGGANLAMISRSQTADSRAAPQEAGAYTAAIHLVIFLSKIGH